MAGFPIEYAGRIKTLPPYLFAAIDEMKQKAIARGVDIINLGIGDPDLPTPAPIVERLQQAAADPKHHQYPSYEGMLSFRTAVADWYRRRFGVLLDPASEVLTLIGSKEGIGHIPLAFVDPGDIVLVPSPGYPVYPVGTAFAGGVSYIMPLLKHNGFLPDLTAIPKDMAGRSFSSASWPLRKNIRSLCATMRPIPKSITTASGRPAFLKWMERRR